jgi:hypothetical protein
MRREGGYQLCQELFFQFMYEIVVLLQVDFSAPE